MSEDIGEIEAEIIERINECIKEFIRRRQEVMEEQRKAEDEYRNAELSEVDAHEMNKFQELETLRRKFDADVRAAATKQHKEQVQCTKTALEALEQGNEDVALALLDESITVGENCIEREIKQLKKEFSEAKRKVIRDCAAAVKATRDEAKRKALALISRSDGEIDEATDQRNQALIELRNEYVRRKMDSDPDMERRAAFKEFTEILSAELTKNGLPGTKANAVPRPKSPKKA